MPYKIDLFAIFIFLGIVQAIFLCFFFFSRENRKVQYNVFQGLLLLTLALNLLEIFLMYTGYIIDCLWLVDFSEPIAFLIGPFVYFQVISLIHGRIEKKHYWHLAFAGIYLLLVIPYFLESDDVKYNSWIYSYHPGWPVRPYDFDYDPRAFWVTDHHTLLTMISLSFYALLGLYEVVNVFRQRKESFLKPKNEVLKKLRVGVMQLVVCTLLIFIVKIFYESDTGDHLFSIYIALIIYMTGFRVINQSGFFRPVSLAEPQKYKSSGVSREAQENMLAKLRAVMADEKPFLQSGFSLPDLAQKLGTTIHTLSQVINEGLGKNFFEMTAEYRVEEAKRLLKEKQNIKVEEIAEQVGYNSKSSFNTAFKKVTGMTPSEFRGDKKIS